MQRIKKKDASKDIFEFIETYNICNEKLEKLEFSNYKYLVSIYKDFSPKLVIKKSAQIGITQMLLTKILFLANKEKMTFIYCLPTDEEVSQLSAVVEKKSSNKTRIETQ